ncbi:hypothetical protein BVRB_4g072130 [Beta vulgaris subsp. vulgaris]|nr:hypothetical protein BVRB_4g072130 [Beta vulgaris subsp. vulgaris]
MAKATNFNLFALCLLFIVIANAGIQMTEAQSCGWANTRDCCYRCGHKCLNYWGGSRPSTGDHWQCRNGNCWCYYGQC